jgi:hypothetical protein
MSSEVETSRWNHGTVFDGIPRLRFAALGMTFQLSSSEKSARSREKFGFIAYSRRDALLAARAQDYLAVPNFAAGYSIPVGIFDHVTS